MDVTGIKKVLDSQIGIPLKEFLISELLKLDSIATLPDKDVNSHQIVTIKARKEAIKIMRSILSQIMDLDQPVKIKDSRDSFVIE